jgi:RND family efflux transporter MFP subunit
MRPALTLTLVLPLIALTACNRQPEVVSASSNTVPVVPVAKAERTDLTGDIKLTAEFEPYQEVDVMAKVSGYVKTITVDIGDRVREGQLLATLEIPEMRDDLARANATIQAAEADVAAARDELRRTESAHELAHLSFGRITDVSNREKGLVPQQQLDEVHSRDTMAEALVAGAKSHLTAAEQRVAVARAEEARVKTMSDYANITAPFAGIVTKRFANKGAMIQAGTASQSQAMPLIRLSQTNVLRLVLPVPESAVSRVHPGETLNVMVPSLKRTFPGRVARSTQTVQMSTRTMDTQVDVQNPGFILVPGMYCEVNLRLDEHSNALAVPLDSVDGTGDAAHAMVVRDGILHRVTIATGLETPQRVEVRSGLQDGDIVVVGRQSGLKEGQRVQAKLVDFAAAK